MQVVNLGDKTWDVTPAIVIRILETRRIDLVYRRFLPPWVRYLRYHVVNSRIGTKEIPGNKMYGYFVTLVEIVDDRYKVHRLNLRLERQRAVSIIAKRGVLRSCPEKSSEAHKNVPQRRSSPEDRIASDLAP